MTIDLSRAPDEIAPSLLGSLLSHAGVTVRLTEVEAYDGASDPASHAFRGMTPRNRVMFGPPGRLYVYFTYGMHWAANVVCGPAGTASAVLLRAGEVVDGFELARARRGTATDRDLARGPARLTQALAITGAQGGEPLFGDGEVCLQPVVDPPTRIERGPRVGVSMEADRRWRFWISGDRFVSAYKRSPRAPAAGELSRPAASGNPGSRG